MKELLKRVISIKYCLGYLLYKFKIKGKQNEILIFNTPNHGNLGDHAILFAEEELLKDNGLINFCIPTFRARYIFNFIKKHTNSKATIFITGGGFCSSDWKNELELVFKVLDEFKSNKIVFFPQTYYFSDRSDFDRFKEKVQNKNVYLFAREEKSYDLLKNKINAANVFFAPDIVLYLKNRFFIERAHNNNCKILFCLRNDLEKKLNNDEFNLIKNELSSDFILEYTDTVLNKKIQDKDRKSELLKKIHQFAMYDYVITDRLHGMVFSVLAGVPCIVISNYNYKVEGVYNTIKDSENVVFVDDIKKINSRFKEMFIEKKLEKDYNDKYKEIINIIKESK